MERRNNGKYMVLAILVAVSYVFFQYLEIPIIDLMPKSMIGSSPENFFNSHSYLIDTLLCIFLTVFYGIWLHKFNLGKTNNMAHSSYNAALNVPLEGKSRDINKKNKGFIGVLWWLIIIVILAFGISGLCQLWLNFADNFLDKISIFKSSMDNFDDDWSDVEDNPYIWVLLSVVIIGPLVEELMFRGLAFGYLERIKTGAFPVIVSGLMFGIWHMELVQSIYAIFTGIILAIIYSYTRNLKITWAIHMVNNFISTLPPSWDSESLQVIITMICYVSIIPMVIISAVIIRKIRRDNS